MMNQYLSLFTTHTKDASSTQKETPPRYNILIVDDEPNTLNALRRAFRQENYQITTASNGTEALEILGRNAFQLMISDYMMPGMNGAELLRAAKKSYPDMIRIMLTGHADTNAVIAAVKDGAVYKFILKPWNDDDLRVTVALALEQYDLRARNAALQQQNKKNSQELEILSRMVVSNRSQLAIMLRKRNLLSDQQIQELYQLQQTRHEPMIKLLLGKGWLAESTIRDVLLKDLLIEEVQLSEININPAIAALLPRSFCERQLVLPIRQEQRRLILAMADPMDMGLIEDMRFSIGLEIHPVMASVGNIQTKIKEVFGAESDGLTDASIINDGTDPLESIEIIIDETDDIGIDELLHSTNDPPAIRLVNAVILEAVRLRASDIHIQPRAKNVVVRYRIDGVMQDKIQVPHALHMALVSRLKVMAALDITERRRPQDGRITVKTPMRIIDLRISTLPTINGEQIVMRILDRNATVHQLSDLGLPPSLLSAIENVVSRPQGIVLTTGPTGSGKTTTLYAMLQHGASKQKHYVTIEDPVEYYLDMAGQVMVRDKIGLGFASVLRSILRQDPDVILLGEIRDHDTAEVAFHAALTGHLVFSSLHTNSALSTIPRLYDLGLKPYVIASSLQLILAQRLARRICPECRIPHEEPMERLRKLGPGFIEAPLTTFRGSGCDKCHGTGYHGRIGIYEALFPSQRMLDIIATGAGLTDLMRCAAEDGFTYLIQDAHEKVSQGITTIDEVLRILGPQVVK